MFKNHERNMCIMWLLVAIMWTVQVGVAAIEGETTFRIVSDAIAAVLTSFVSGMYLSESLRID